MEQVHFHNKELLKQLIKEIKIARKEFKEGKFVSHAQLKKELGL